MPPFSFSPLARGASVALLSLALLPAGAGAATPGGGGAPSPSIIGGHAPAAGTWPSLVALLQHGTADTWQAQFCGGTLIAPRWVLTAAHCTVDESAATIDVLAGTHTLGDGSGTRVTAAEVHEHPAYDSDTTANDISLLKLSAPLAQPTMAIAGPGLEPFWSAGRSAHAAGWGNVSTTTTSYPRALREVDIPLVSDSACGSVWGAGFNAAVMVCAAGSGVDTCQGDSGGPLTVSDAAGRMVLIGGTSFGADCADPLYPGVYAETYAFRAWIDATVGWSRALGADRSSVAFTRPTTGSLSTSVTVTLSAGGSAPLALASVRLSGTGADQFELLNDSCSATGLTAGSSCTIDVRAAPTVDADAAAWLTINSDIPGGVTSIPLTSGTNPPDPGEPDPPTTDPGGGDPGGGTTDPGDGGTTDPGDSDDGSDPTGDDGTPDPGDSGSDPTDVGDDSAPGVLRPIAGPTGPAASIPVPTPAPTAAAKRAPKATIATASRKGSTRRLSLRLAAAGTVKVTIQTRTRRPLTVATATLRFTNAGTKVVALKLTPTARHLLRTAGRIPATATATVTAPGATATTSTLRLTLR